MIALRYYQEKAIDELRAKSNNLLRLSSARPKTLSFQAPTGSGKTIVVAEFLKRFVLERDDDLRFSFIWAAPRKLHTQSKEKLERYYFDSKALRCINFEDISNHQIGNKEILFLNWESINRAENSVIIRDNERDFNLSTVLKNTIDEERIIILIIDESHHTADSEKSVDLIASTIKPRLTIEVSATPIKRGDDSVVVQREHVIDDQMIKEVVSINPGFKNTIVQGLADLGRVKSELSESADDFVLRMAITQRNHLKRLFEDADSDVNPLLLIQLPDKRQGEEDKKDDVEHELKERHSITVANGKLAVYLSEDKRNLEQITRIDSEVEVMIFKQAIALGWDCPRAAILVLFREWKSFRFSVQTLGRIMRMPELKHYENNELNAGYVFTNLGDLTIDPDIAGFACVYSAKRRDIYKPLALTSYHAKRFREETRLNPEFIDVFFRAADELNLKDKINLKVSGISKQMVTDGFITDIDTKIEHLVEPHIDESYGGETTQRRMLPVETQKVFDDFVRENLAPYAPEQRSFGRLKEAIYRYLTTTFPMEVQSWDLHTQYIVLNIVNRRHFIDAINRAKILYQDRVGRGKQELLIKEDWEIRKVDTYSGEHNFKKMSRCIMDSFYERSDASEPERKFVAFLESELAGVEWWYKNGERDAQYFAVGYSDSFGISHSFYVDWIVKFEDGRIGLFDTKSGITAGKEAKEKAEGLSRYIHDENKKGKKLCGGIVIEERGSWLYNDNDIYEYNPNDLSKWKFVSQLGTGFQLSLE